MGVRFCYRRIARNLSAGVPRPYHPVPGRVGLLADEHQPLVVPVLTHVRFSDGDDYVSDDVRGLLQLLALPASLHIRTSDCDAPCFLIQGRG